MRRAGCKLALCCVWSLAAAGCEHPCAPITLDTRGVVPAASYDGLAEVLATAVRRNGLANAEMLKKHAAALDAQLKLLAVTGPTATPKLLPTEAHRLAYWYNAHAAWSMKLLLVEECPAEVHRSRLEGRPFPLDGRTMTLRLIGRELERDEDFRTAAAVPGATTQHARLPGKPFEAKGIRRRIAERFAELIDDPLRFVIDIPHQRIVVPRCVWEVRERILRRHWRTYGVGGATLTTALLGHVSGSPHRRLQDAIGYRVVAAAEKLTLVDEQED